MAKSRPPRPKNKIKTVTFIVGVSQRASLSALHQLLKGVNSVKSSFVGLILLLHRREKQAQSQRERETHTHTPNRTKQETRNTFAMAHPVALAGVLTLLSLILAIHNWHKTSERVPLWWDLQGSTLNDL